MTQRRETRLRGRALFLFAHDYDAHAPHGRWGAPRLGQGTPADAAAIERLRALGCLQ